MADNTGTRITNITAPANKPADPYAGVSATSPHANGETDPERAKLRDLLGRGADSQMGLPPNRTTSDVVATEHPKSIDYGRPAATYNEQAHREALERERANPDLRQSAHHITDPDTPTNAGAANEAETSRLGADNAAAPAARAGAGGAAHAASTASQGSSASSAGTAGTTSTGTTGR